VCPASGRTPSSHLHPSERVLLERYVDALRRHDVVAVVALARADADRTASEQVSR